MPFYKYDDAGWHAGGDFPDDLPYSQGGVHMAMFLIWAIRRDLYNREIFEVADVEAIKAQRMPILGVLDRYDEKLVTEDFNDEGNAFTTFYYGAPSQKNAAPFLNDYERTLGESLPSLYHVAPTWENYARLEPVIDRRYQDWITRGRVGPPRMSRFRDVAAWVVGLLMFGFGAVVLLLLAIQWLRR